MSSWIPTPNPNNVTFEKSHSIVASLLADLQPAQRQKYSYRRLIQHLAGERTPSGKPIEAGLEMEISQAFASQLGASARGEVYAPTRLYATALDTKTDAAGKYTVQTEVREIVEILAAKARVIQLGATFLSGLQGNISWPTHDTMGGGSWVGENPGSDVNDEHSTFGQRLMVPHTFMTSTAFSRQLLAQSSSDIEGFVRSELALRHALEIDRASINGSGGGFEPLGILGTSNVGSVVIAANAGGCPSYDKIIELEAEVADANADEPGMKFLTTPAMRGRLRKLPLLDATTGVPVWQNIPGNPGVGDLAGYPAYVSKQVPSTLVSGANSDCHAIIFGYWPSLYIGEWGVLELIVDPLRLKKQGMIEITSFQMVDLMLRHPEQFAAIQDARDVDPT